MSKCAQDKAKPDLAAVLAHYGIEFSQTKGTIRCPLPDHDDLKPSCSIDLKDGLWHCHACGKGGDSYSLISDMEGVDFVGAAQLAATHGLAADSLPPSGEHLSGSSHAGGRGLFGRSRADASDRPRRPNWLRR